MPEAVSKSASLLKIVVFLAVIGIGLASYLLYEYFANDPLGICSISATVNCTPITKGNLAEIFGVPVAAIGLIGYVVILISALADKRKLMLGMTTFGMLFCLRLTILEIFVENVICPLCVACQLIMVAVFILSIKLLKLPQETTEED